MTRNVVRVAEALVRLRRQDGTFIHLDIEPEPDCVLENTDESLAFFEQWLFPVGAPLLADALGVSADEARRHLQDHITLCFDCCHFAVEFENPATALERLQAAGIRIGRVQLSSALHVQFPADAQEAAAVAGRLRPFADTTYLHQVVEQQTAGLRRYPDLDVALENKGTTSPAEWRIHFHVPLFTRELRRVRVDAGLRAERPRPGGAVTIHDPPRDRDLHVGRAAARAQVGRRRVDRPRVRVGAARSIAARPIADIVHRTVVLNVVGLTPRIVRSAAAPHLGRWAATAALARIRAGVSCRDLHGAVRLPDRALSQHTRHRRQRLVRARGRRDQVLEAVEPARAGAEDLGRARRRADPDVHVCQPFLVVQHVLDRGLQRHATADVSRRRPEASRRLHVARRPARRAAVPSSARSRSSASGGRRRRSSRRAGSPSRRSTSSRSSRRRCRSSTSRTSITTCSALARATPRRPWTSSRCDELCGDLIAFYEARGVQVVILSEYGLCDVTTPVHINRVLREHGLIAVREELGLEVLDPGASAAFAVADHQVAHVYVNDPSRHHEVRALLEKTPGIERVLDGDGKAALGSTMRVPATSSRSPSRRPGSPTTTGSTTGGHPTTRARSTSTASRATIPSSCCSIRRFGCPR